MSINLHDFMCCYEAGAPSINNKYSRQKTFCVGKVPELVCNLLKVSLHTTDKDRCKDEYPVMYIMEKFPCLAALGFTVPVSERLEINQVEDKYITNKLLLELNTIKEKSNGQYTYQDVLNWISSLCGK
ncbi:Hypothetical predicted protein [Mytilus galloprovincialis]|uniref:Uncharacterized protein n=1 Tax=Mytilus galloprovincialis TaxID=29158 RepID=A0A8B6EPU4_MYTGA|nr:Hypothetical predicted protein [Mytilus galloprovincialis]